jgi:phosphonate transport system substrate-binding protein
MTRISRRILLAAAASSAAFPAFAQTRDPSRLRLALLPDENASTIIQNAQPLKAHLERVLRKEIELVVTTDYSSMIEAARFGRIEIAYFGPFSYVLAKSRAPGIEAFAVGVERGAPHYHSVVIAQKGGPVAALADVRGKPFAYGDQASTSSHLVPRALLLQRAGLDGARDYRPVHVGTHDAVARTVQSGQAPAGALSKPILDTLYQRNVVDRERLVEIALSDPIPNYPMVLQGNLVPALKDAIRAAFLELKDEQILRSFRVQGFAPTDDKAYDVLRETARVLQLDLTQMRG